MRSYLAWQGPAVERVIVLSFVAGTEGWDIHAWEDKTEKTGEERGRWGKGGGKKEQMS